MRRPDCLFIRIPVVAFSILAFDREQELIDLRTDSHDAPLEELCRLYTIFGENDRRVEF